MTSSRETPTLTLPPLPTEMQARAALARIPISAPPGLWGRLLTVAMKRMYGDSLDNGFALAHHRGVLTAVLGFERRVARWRALDPTLKALAVMTVSARIGCSWCVDFGYHLAHTEGIELRKLAEVLNWRTAHCYDDVERRVIEYADAMTATPPQVTDEMVAALRSDLGDKAVVELTMMIAVENERSRFNSALGLVAQGFSAQCQVPQGQVPQRQVPQPQTQRP